jgi:hypothetical protein
VPGEPGEGRRDGLHDNRVAPPGAADDDQPRVGERDDVGEDSADGLAEGVPHGRGPSVLAGGHAEQAAGIDGRRAGPAQAEFAEYLDQGCGPPVRADGDDVRDLASQPSPPPATTMCSAFRTFQGWTALSDMDHDQGVLHTVPIPAAMAYLMLRPLLADVPEDDMCGVTINQVFPANETWHPLLVRALSGIPDVRAGDSVWWHCDMIHSVAPVRNQQGWGNVMYIPAAPWCPRNRQYAVSVREAFLTGSSPADFPEEHYERGWASRFAASDLNATGRRGLGLD